MSLHGKKGLVKKKKKGVLRRFWYTLKNLDLTTHLGFYN
jgi:hypothetical protein